MKKIILIIITGLLALSTNAQNYFSSYVVKDEFGKSKEYNINGRINISDTSVTVKYADGVINTYEILKSFEVGSRKKPSEFDELPGHFYYDTGYRCIKCSSIYVFVKRTFVGQYTYSYLNHRWIIWKIDLDGEVIETIVYYP